MVLPHIAWILGLLAALAAVGTDDPARQEMLAAAAAILFGLSAALSGMRALARGRVLLKTRHAVRDEQPVAFWTAVLLFRFGVGAVLIATGVWKFLGSE